jgi:hypothetical protein
MAQSQFDPGFVAFGGGSAGSILHPVVMVGVLVVVASAFLLPRKYIIFPLILGMFLTPAGQNLNLGAHFYVCRILILVGWVRLFMSKPETGKFLPGGLITLDKVFLMWAIYRMLSESLQYLQVGAVIYQFSQFADAVCGYFMFRSLIRDDSDVRRMVTAFAVVALVSSAVMIRELMTGQNLMGLLGGIRLNSDVRNGRIRAQGVFQHSILAGSFGATVFPLFLWLWKGGSGKLTALVGAVASSIMVFTCASSTPVAAWLGTFVAICIWPLRRKMRFVRWIIVVALLGLGAVMKAPIWFILARIDFAGGSSGWERAFLIDTFTRHVGDWWLIGTHDNANWGWDMWDQCNQFVSEGESGGIVAFTCFIAMIVICFKKAGSARKLVDGSRRREWSFWLLGAAMFAQVLAFMGVDYFDQSKFLWYALLSIFPASTMAAQGAFTPKMAEASSQDVRTLVERATHAGSGWKFDDL